MRTLRRYWFYLRAFIDVTVYGRTLLQKNLQPWWVVRNGTSPTKPQPWQNSIGTGHR